MPKLDRRLFSAMFLVGDGSLLFVYLPAFKSFAEAKRHDARMQVLEVLGRLQIPVIDLYAVFLAHDDPVGLFPQTDGTGITPWRVTGSSPGNFPSTRNGQIWRR